MTDQKSTEAGIKVFVGNLSFSTNDAQLNEFCSTAGKVLSCNIITRGPRSLGYGFVTYATDADAKKAVALLNKKDLDGREVNVEQAAPRDESAPRPTRGRGQARRGRHVTSANRREEREPRDSTPSKTALFVANLPFKMDDAGLTNLFKKFNPTKVHVIIRRNGMSKGFGFVEFASHDVQQKALNEMHDVECEGRKISVKVALGEEYKPEEDTQQ